MPKHPVLTFGHWANILCYNLEMSYYRHEVNRYLSELFRAEIR